MIDLFLFPEWFSTPDVMIDFFSFLVVFIFAVISLRYYQLNKNRRFLYLGLAFLLLGVGELSRIIMNLGLYFNLATTYRLGRVMVESKIIESVDDVYNLGFFIHRFLVMLGFYLIYYTTKKEKSRSEHLLIIYFIMILTFFTSKAYHIFNITITIFLFIIVIRYIKLYLANKSQNTKILSYSFFILLISYIIMVFAEMNSNLYLAANMLQLVSYILFLCIILRIYKYGKKK